MASRGPTAFLAALLWVVLPAHVAAAGANQEIVVHVTKDGPEISVDVDCPVDAPWPVVWEVLTDYDHMAQFVSNLEHSGVEQRTGNVLRVHQKSAGVVQAGTLLVEVGDPSALEVVVDLLTTDAVHVTPGTLATIEGWGGDTPLSGRVRRVEPSAFTRPSALGVDEQRVNVVIALTDVRERWAALADGYRVEARLVLWRGDDVLRVPQGAVFRHGDGWAVFRIDGSRARLTPVTVGHRGDTELEILSGLGAGDRVAVHPGDRVKDGVEVEER